MSRAPGRQAAPAEPQAAVPAAEDTEKSRFGINSLINRMTGAQAEASSGQPARVQPEITPLRQEPEASEDQDRIEIPAFLRRQAN